MSNAYSDIKLDSSVKASMKWFYFLIYFLLWVSPVINLLTSIPFLTGSRYSDFIYQEIDGLQLLDITYGIYLILIAVFMIITRFKLAKFKTNAPIYIITIYFSTLISSALYSLISSILAELTVFDTLYDLTPILIGKGLVVLLNILYFKKRTYLFNN